MFNSTQAVRVTPYVFPVIRSNAMNATPTKRTAQKVSAQPFLRRLKERGVNQSRFAIEHGYTPADITNWKARGVPRAELPKLARWCGLSVDSYLIEAGAPQPAAQSRPLEVAALLADYEALPDFLKGVIARKTAALRRYVDSADPLTRKLLDSTPDDPARHRQWEQEIEAAMHVRLNTSEPPPASRKPHK